MRRFLLMFICCMMFTSNYAEQVIPLDPEPDDDGVINHPQKSPALLPRLSYENDYLFITSPYVVIDAEIIIRDVYGNILYDSIVTLPASSYVMVLPNSVNSDKYSIQLYINGHSYIGYF
ncbi:MAG: DUF3244 domain-containing protein [Prevotella sp.]|nr:DUF3244 domain-containing protein [Prevotella sp.]